MVRQRLLRRSDGSGRANRRRREQQGGRIAAGRRIRSAADRLQQLLLVPRRRKRIPHGGRFVTFRQPSGQRHGKEPLSTFFILSRILLFVPCSR